MTKRMTQWVLWISLLLIVPLPIFWAELGYYPVGHLIYSWFCEDSVPLIDTLLITGQSIGYLLALWWCARAYVVVSDDWTEKITGSIMCLAVFSTLILVSSVGVYQLPNKPVLTTFLQLYTDIK
ncbi:hypothetical protein OAV62_01730 [bacterium]|nr:hypothetical protein [bacterium]